MEGSPLARSRGRPRKPIGEIIKKDLDFNNLSIDMISDRILWRHLIHVADSTWWEKAWLLLLLICYC